MTLRYLKLAVGLAGLLSLPASATADSTEQITNFAQTAILNRAGALSISEKIDYDFATAAPHDISFSIPLSYHDDQGREFRMNFSLTGAELDGQSIKISPQVTAAIAKFTLPPGTGSAARHYELSYKLAPVVLSGPSADLLRLSVTGLGWAVPILHTTLHLETPVASADNLTCFAGSQGGTTGQCTAEQKGNVSDVVAYATLQPGESLSVATDFPSKSFSGYLKTYEAHPSSPLRKIIEGVSILLIITAIFIGLALRRRRNYTNANEASKDQV